MKKILITLAGLCLYVSTLNAQLADLGGKITRMDGTPSPGITVQLMDSNGAILTMDTTTAEGRYTFDGLASNQVYTVVPVDNGQISPLAGVSTLDLIIGARHILGIQSAGSPFAIAAGDVNNSGTFTTLDLVLMRRLILGVDSSFPNAPSTRFLRTNTSFGTPGQPFSGIHPGSPTILLDESAGEFDFFQIKTGDVSNP